MKDFYGKTYKNTDFLHLQDRFLYRMRLIDAGFKQLFAAFSKRPSLAPALLILLCSFLSCHFASVLPAFLLSAAVLTAFVLFCLKSRKPLFFKVNMTVLALLFSLVLVYLGMFISTRLNAYTEPSSNNEYICTATRISFDLSGKVDLTVRLESGALSKITCYKDIEGFADINPGDQLLIHGKLKEPSKAGNPGELDYRDYLRSRGILYVIRCDRFEVISKAGFPSCISGVLQRFFFLMRRDVLNAVSGSFDETYKALAAAVCVGDRSLVPDRVNRDFQISCCSHLLAVSGTHFTGFLACLPAVLNALKVKRRKAFAIHILFCILTGCLTGWSDSVTRAAFMSICCFADRDWVSALSLASIVMTVSDPFCPQSSGFQMSFCAVIAIKIYTVKISGALKKLRLGEKIPSLVSPAIAATLGMIPFWTDISMRPDPLHLAVQIAGSFVAGLTCTCFVPCVLLCLLLPFLSEFISAPLLTCLKLLNSVIGTGSTLSSGGSPPVHLSAPLLLAAGLTLFLFMLPPCFVRRAFLKLSALILAASVGLEVFSFVIKPENKIVFADVGQGDCCLIITSGLTCLIDAGTYEEGASTVSDLLDYYGISQVDISIMSHWDVDHSGGIAALSEQGRAGTVMTAYVPEPDIKDKDVEEFFESTKTDRQAYLSNLFCIRAGDRIELSDSAFIDILYPYVDANGGNDSSLVLMLNINGKKILFTGDISTKTEELMIDAGIDIDCDLLKVAHHGSKYSSSTGFIEACSPSAAIISVGANNFYGHPSPDTLDRLESYGCEVFRTDLEGAVILEY